jgi:hypothetical protein
MYYFNIEGHILYVESRKILEVGNIKFISLSSEKNSIRTCFFTESIKILNKQASLSSVFILLNVFREALDKNLVCVSKGTVHNKPYYNTREIRVSCSSRT